MCSVHQHKKMYNRWISSSRRENRQHLPIRTHKIWHLVLKPEESYCPLPPGKTKEEHPPRAPECADGAETSTNVSGWASFVRALTWCFAEKCSYDEKSWHNKREKLTNIRIHIYIYIANETSGESGRSGLLVFFYISVVCSIQEEVNRLNPRLHLPSA